MFFLFGRLNEGIDNVAQYMQRFINVTTLPQSFSFNIGMLYSFASSQIDNI